MASAPRTGLTMCHRCLKKSEACLDVVQTPRHITLCPACIMSPDCKGWIKAVLQNRLKLEQLAAQGKISFRGLEDAVQEIKRRAKEREVA